jgi:Flp pilus assembly pilin Flp
MRDIVQNFLADERATISVEYGFAMVFAGLLASKVLIVYRDHIYISFMKIHTEIQNYVNAITY